MSLSAAYDAATASVRVPKGHYNGMDRLRAIANCAGSMRDASKSVRPVRKNCLAGGCQFRMSWNGF